MFIKTMAYASCLILLLLIFCALTFYQIGYLKAVNSALINQKTGEYNQSQKRLYYFPVQPPELCSYDDEHHDYPACDIFAPFGTAIVSITNGSIEWLCKEDLWDAATDEPAQRGGLAISIKGDDGLRYYYAHLSRIAYGLEQGMSVAAGQLIGYLGKSGNARNTASHLHLGISKPTYATDWQTRRGQIWPQRFLDEWKEGNMVTPPLPDN